MIRVLRPIPAERIQLLVFDLDGTLIDSARDLCNSVNAALEHMGRPHLDDRIIASFVGNGAPMLVRRSLAVENSVSPDEVHDEELATAYNFFLAHYREHKLDFTYAYDGVVESLAALCNGSGGAPRKMAVLTNKPVRPARAICEGLGMGDFFFRVCGGDSFPLKKPDPLGLRSLMEEAGVTPDETVMIGDSKVDVLTARNAGAFALGCQFGFGPQNLLEAPPDVVVDSALDWMAALLPGQAVID
ncbi:MAG TPA: HAD-IA family hydrolase [Terracidiphilus sp.]|jgi:phosphoglycolate phosphatase|nr:HAD-IA family hydrolase [Terracidiphilus sp.]